jgi:hypothetical protein
MNLISSIFQPFHPKFGTASLRAFVRSAPRRPIKRFLPYRFLPSDLDPQLDLAGRGRRRINYSRASGIYAVKSGNSIELEVIDRGLKIGVIQNVEELKSQLSRKRLGNLGNT